MTVNKINKLKIPIFKVNPALNTLQDVPMFEDKIAEANEVLRTVGLPDLPIAKQKKAKRVMKGATKKQTSILRQKKSKSLDLPATIL